MQIKTIGINIFLMPIVYFKISQINTYFFDVSPLIK
jgi:hypothetical protein